MSALGDVELPGGFIRDLAAAADVEAIVTVAADWLPQLIPVARSSVALPVAPGMLQVFAFSGPTAVPTPPLPISDSIVGTAFRDQIVVRLSDPSRDDGVDGEYLRDAGLRSVLSAPMISNGRSLGTLNLGQALPDFFNKGDEARLVLLADLIAAFLNVHNVAAIEIEQASIDHLTGCRSRRRVLEVLGEELEQEEPPSVLYFDLDNFKRINDGLGHHVGDAVLRHVSSAAQELVEPDDTIGRLGGDEFLIVVAADAKGSRAQLVAHKLLREVRRPLEVDGVTLSPSLSIGVASPGAERDPAPMLNDADQAMYAAKQGPRVVVADDALRQRSALIAAVDRDLQDSFGSGRFSFDYQVVRDLTTREVLGAEALLQWSDPVLGSVPAAVIRERAAASQRTGELSRWSLDAVGADLAYIRSAIPWFDDKAISLDVTPGQLSTGWHCSAHWEAIERHGLRVQDIITEIVESEAIPIDDPAERTLLELAEMGALIALDNFGGGHNTLRYFDRFPIHAVKFDPNLITSVARNNTVRTVVDGLATMLHELDVVSLALGLENEVQARHCQLMGISQGQGKTFGPRLPVDDFIATLRDEPSTVRGWSAVLLD